MAVTGMRPLLICALAVSLLAGGAAHAADGATIVRIVVDGNQRISAEAVLHLMTVREGDPYDEDLLREEFKRIWARGLFRDLSIESREVEGGMAVIVHVQEKPVVTSLVYDESKVVSESQIEDMLSTRGTQIDIGEPIDYDAIKKAEEGIKALLNQKGFLDAEVRAETNDLGGGNVEIEFKIDEGAKTRIKSIRFVGNEVFSSRKLKKALKNTKEKGWFTRLKQKDVYHPLKYDTDLREVQTLYENNGYIDVDLPPAKVTVLEEKVAKKPGKSRKWIAIEQRVSEGEQYRVGEISVEGNTVFPDQELRMLMPLQRGAVLDESLVKVGLALIDARYGEKGYFYISTNRLIDRHPDATADLTVKINEDRQYYLDRIEFAGNTSTRDFVLRREFPLAEGELFDLRQFRLGLRRISQLGYFQLSGEPEITPVPGENKLRVTVEGTEPRRSELQLGGGFSGIDGGFFATSYQTRNFLGRGNVVGVNAQVGGIASRYTVSFTEPYLLGRPITAGFSLFRRDQDYVGFTTKGEGASVTLGRRFKNFQNISVNFLHETTDFDPDDGFSSTTVVNSVRPFYSFDTRNNFLRPTRGVQLLLSTEYAGGALGGEVSFVKPIFEFQYYLPFIRRTYLAFHLEAGFVRGLHGDLIPTYERFFLGGERSLRNFRTRSVGPSGFICNPEFAEGGDGVSEAVESPEDCPGQPRPRQGFRDQVAVRSDLVGGDRNLLFNAEYVIPLSEPVDFVIYADVGNALAEWEEIEFGRFRGDAGFELRFYLPVFGAPLRLIWGQTFNETGVEETKGFLFSIGKTF